MYNTSHVVPLHCQTNSELFGQKPENSPGFAPSQLFKSQNSRSEIFQQDSSFRLTSFRTPVCLDLACKISWNSSHSKYASWSQRFFWTGSVPSDSLSRRSKIYTNAHPCNHLRPWVFLLPQGLGQCLLLRCSCCSHAVSLPPPSSVCRSLEPADHCSGSAPRQLNLGASLWYGSFTKLSLAMPLVLDLGTYIPSNAGTFVCILSTSSGMSRLDRFRFILFGSILERIRPFARSLFTAALWKEPRQKTHVWRSQQCSNKESHWSLLNQQTKYILPLCSTWITGPSSALNGYLERHCLP